MPGDDTWAERALRAMQSTWEYAFAHGDSCCMGPPDDAALKLLEREQQLLAIIERRSASPTSPISFAPQFRRSLSRASAWGATSFSPRGGSPPPPRPHR